VFVIIFCIAVLLVFLIVPKRRMWAQPAPSIQRHEIRNCVNICLKVNCDSNELKECNKKKMYVYVPTYNSMLIYLAVMCIFVIYKCLSGMAISSKICAAKPEKNSQTKQLTGSC
jgi:hypothetical protein